jgi:hypothetical protein
MLTEQLGQHCDHTLVGQAATYSYCQALTGELIDDIEDTELDAYRVDDERLMTVFAERAAMALERTKLY